MSDPQRDEQNLPASITVPPLLQVGTPMTKISEGKKKRIIFRLDGEEGRILYESKKRGISSSSSRRLEKLLTNEKSVPIESIKELRTGLDARYYRAQFSFSPDMEDRWITVIYILEGTYKTLHMLADTPGDFSLWETALKKLCAIRQGLMNGLGNVDMRQAVWERQYWKGADKQNDQKLEFDEVEGLCKRLNVNMPTADLQRLFKEADTKNRGYLDFVDFQWLVKVLKKRPEIEKLYQKLSSLNGGKFDYSIFEKFMHDSQKSILKPDDLKLIFGKYASFGGLKTPSPPDNPVQAVDPSSAVMSLDGFSAFLVSPENSAFSEQNLPVWQDMTRPISEYYLSSSHNTYLVGHQLVGVSTIEGYIRALLHSCRSVELDIYDGDTEPAIYHGKTLTSKVSLKEVCQAIAKYAFVTSPYPVIISAEVHCKIEQQDMMVNIMNETFGEALVQAPIEGRPKITQLPSPEDLRGKFLLKAKNLYVVEQLAAIQQQQKTPTTIKRPAFLEADPSSSSSSDSDPGVKEEIKAEIKTKWRKLRGKGAAKPEKPKVRMSFALASLLVYTVGVKCHGISSTIEYAPEHIFSLSENSANRLLKASMNDLVEHNKNHVTRIYPKGTRVNSTNYEPHRYWAAGSQVVAINWQTFDLGYMINQAMFQRNGRSGYVLKPRALRENLPMGYTKHFLDVNIISAQQLPRPKDSNGQEIIEKSIVDPFVEVSLHIPDWTHSPFIPEASKLSGAIYLPPTDATRTSATSARTITLRTGVIKNNGFNPAWHQELCLPYDCVGGMTELIFVKFAVRQDGKDGDDPLAVYCIPLSCLEHGYRHLPLHDTQLSQHLFSTLFVQISLRDVK
ncbi:1-phosphatidylinositol-4,5-bisphosphate phosphodiesterase 1 [Infundibulicybe gibba]|nr:1-phosphatidylinositol-4,5-bisphosphate phosphodiesterase 1 [Infundibulicybe gibba]